MPLILALGLPLLPNRPLQAANPVDFLPPAPPWHGASESLIVPTTHPWITPAEKMGLLDTPNYADTIAYLQKLVAASPQLKLHAFGQTAQGRILYAVVATKEGAADPAGLVANGRPTVLAQAGIHSGEIDGKDAGLMLLRDLAQGGKSALLNHANFLFVPIFNADGHERSSLYNRPNQRGPVHQGWRTTAQNLNLNRDYVKADAPEMRAMISLINAANPVLYFDLHVTDGMDYAYDITYGYPGFDGEFAWSPQIAAWLEHTLRPAVDGALKQNGHIPGGLVNDARSRDLTQGLVGGHIGPRFSTGFGDLRHLPTILVENHSLKPYPQRVLGDYILLEAALRTVGDHATPLRAAIAADCAAHPATIPMNWGVPGGPTNHVDFLGIAHEEYLSPTSGKPEVRWLGKPKLYPQIPVFGDRPALQLVRPKAYYVPVTKPEVIQRLRLQGIRLETLTTDRTVTVDMYRLANVKPSAEPFESHYLLSAQAKIERHTETFPAGSVRVTTDQPLGDFAVVVLEPESNDSFFAWGFFNEILQRTEYMENYAIAPMAEKMLAEDPALQTEFTAKLKSDPAFAASSSARLQWFYDRSPFSDQRYLLYPIGIER